MNFTNELTSVSSIFALPPAEVAVHPDTTGDRHELYLICEDVTAFVAKMAEHGVETTPHNTAANPSANAAICGSVPVVTRKQVFKRGAPTGRTITPRCNKP